jgi:hypothetical protein
MADLEDVAISIACELKITGIKKIALTRVRPLNLEFKTTAIIKLKIKMIGNSVNISNPELNNTLQKG